MVAADPYRVETMHAEQAVQHGHAAFSQYASQKL
jgi:hypothetical protein